MGNNNTDPVYWEPNPTAWDSFTYCASQQLIPVADDRVLTGRFTFPLFKSAPSISAQIISSVGAALVQIYAVKIGIEQGTVDLTVIVVEAETIAPVIPDGSYYLNITVIGAPATRIS
jgi:hypothetical protein